MSILVGVQLLIVWFIMQVLEELSQRQQRVDGDLRGIADYGSQRMEEARKPVLDLSVMISGPCTP